MQYKQNVKTSEWKKLRKADFFIFLLLLFLNDYKH